LICGGRPGNDEASRAIGLDDLADDVEDFRLVTYAMLPRGAGLPVGDVVVAPILPG
jgi:hypothetical protein